MLIGITTELERIKYELAKSKYRHFICKTMRKSGKPHHGYGWLFLFWFPTRQLLSNAGIDGTPCKCLQSIFLSPCSMQIPFPWPLLSWSRGNNQSRITGAIKTIHPSLFFCLSQAWDAEYWMFCCNFVIISTFQGIRTLPQRLAAAASPGLAQATLRSLDFLLRIFTSRWSSLIISAVTSDLVRVKTHQHCALSSYGMLLKANRYKLKCLMRSSRQWLSRHNLSNL